MKIIICFILLIFLVPSIACSSQPSIASTNDSDLEAQILALQKRFEILEEKVFGRQSAPTIDLWPPDTRSLEARIKALEDRFPEQSWLEQKPILE